MSANNAPSAKAFHSFEGRPTGTSEKRREGQPGNRRFAVHYDQHGRQWWSSIELRSGTSVGTIEPNFVAPWYPDQQYLVENPANVTELWIDYRRMATDRKVSLDEYHADAVQYAADNKWPAPKYGDYPSEIVQKKGHPSRSFKLVVAAWQGNPWILGLSDTPDPRLEELVKRERPVRAINLQDFATEDFGAESYAAATGVELSGRTPAPVDGRKFAFGADSTDSSFLEELDRKTAAIANANPDEYEGDEFDASGIDPEPTRFEGLVQQLDEEEDDLDEQHDPQALGGRTVAPGHEERAARQAPRRPGSSANLKPGGKKRPTLADGAAPVIAGAGIE